jgi:hypothetical protein
MKRTTDEELMAYHLGDLSRWRRMQMHRGLERDAELAAQSEEIAATLRAFCCDPAPVVSDAMVEHSWQRVRGSLGVLEAPRRSRVWVWSTASASIVAVLLLAVVAETHGLIGWPPPPPKTTASDSGSPKNWSQKLLAELHRKPVAQPYNNRPGPLTTAPVDAVAEDPALATHLDTAERVLTEVSHTNGPLQPETREQVHRLLLENAVYHQSAEQRGDRATAAVIDDLGRVLISLDAEPLSAEQKERDPDAFRLQMNLGGVLLDLRILHHNSDSQ